MMRLRQASLNPPYRCLGLTLNTREECVRMVMNPYGRRLGGLLTWSLGKNWHSQKKPFRPTQGLTSYAKRMELEKIKQATKAREQEMREGKEQEHNRRIQAIKDRRKAKEEKERYEQMAEKMHRKRVERRKRREKRNKLLNS